MLFVLMLFFSFSFSLSSFSEPQQHIEDRSFSRMLWPNSSVSKEVSSSHGDDTHIPLFTLHDMCIYCACRRIYSYVNGYIYVEAHMCTYIYIFSLPITVHHIHTLSEYGWHNMVDMLLLHDSGIAELPGSLSA